MTGRERKIFVQTLLVGGVLTVAVMAADAIGGLGVLERWLYDRRARDNQRFMPMPTDRLIHLDIDDAALEAVGRYPWDRWKFALIVDQIKRLGAKVLAFDVLFPDPQKQSVGEWEQASGKLELIDNDQMFAQSLDRAGNVLLPVSFQVLKTFPPIYEQIIEVLMADLHQTKERVIAQLGGDPQSTRRVDFLYLAARRQAAYRLVHRELDRVQDASFSSLRRKLLPQTGAMVTGSAELTVVGEQYDKARSIREIRLLALQTPADWPPVLRSPDQLPPIVEFSEVAAATAFVDYLPDADGIVRSMPLFVEHQDRLYPQFGLSLACLMLGVDLSDIQIVDKDVVLPRPDGPPIRIPIQSKYYRSIRRRANMVMDISWRGPVDDWRVMYDPARKTSKNHLPITKIWECIQTRRKIAANIANVDEALKAVLESLDPGKLEAFLAMSLAADDLQARSEHLDWANRELTSAGYTEYYAGIDPQQLQGAELTLFRSIQAVCEIPRHTAELVDQLHELEADLQQRLEGRAAIVGWTATGALADFVPTPLHARCPGAVVHGAIFNAIMTGELWGRTALWVTLLATVVIGLATTAVVAALSPVKSLVAAMILGAGYFTVNGVVIFDLYNTIIGTAGPVVAAAVVWSGCTLFRFVVERAERVRITRRFRSYVDPALVDFVIEHPERAQLAGELGELTVAFSDLAGFTTLSEKLRERTVPILNDYMGLMVPIIRKNRGYVNKFLGDGIMYFYGAPRENKLHAMDAVATSLEMQDVMVVFNERIAKQGLSPVNMRIGISTGNMVVGDAGSSDASDYTVLGNAVNLGARLESANKAVGTHIMINDRAAMLVEDSFLLCPIGRLQVVGKTQGVMTFQPLCPIENATDERKRQVELTDAMVDAYILGRFSECIERAGKLDAVIGPSKLADLYTTICQRYMQQDPDVEFLGQIVLEEK